MVVLVDCHYSFVSPAVLASVVPAAVYMTGCGDADLQDEFVVEKLMRRVFFVADVGGHGKSVTWDCLSSDDQYGYGGCDGDGETLA